EEGLAFGRPRLALRRTDFCELHHEVSRARIERDEVYVVAAEEADVALPAGPVRARLLLDGAGDLPAGAGHGVHHHHVAVVHGENPAMRVVPNAVRGRGLLPLLVGETARLAALAGDHPGRGLVFSGVAPLEVQLARVPGPAQARGGIADELGTAHDAVDGQLELRGRRRDESGGGDYERGGPESLVHGTSPRSAQRQ